MDNRLVLVVLFVMLSWVSMSTYAQTTVASNVTNSNMTTASDSNMTTASDSNMTTASDSNMTTAAGNNVTSDPNATMATNMTTAAGNNVTSDPNATMATNMTTAAGNNVTSDPNATMATNMTTAAGNNVTSDPNATMATNMTTAAGNNTNNTTASPTIAATTATPTTITTVGTLPSSVSNSDCKTGKLCAAEPSSCNPSGARSCFFLSAKQNNGQSFDFELSGESNGYIAATLSTDSSLGGNDSTYVCANNNSAVKFIGASLDNGQLTQTDLSGSNVRGNISGNRIQCTFTATVSNTAVRAASFAVGISTGPFNSTSGTLGNPVFVFRSSVINLQNVNTTVNNEITNHAITFQLSLMQALLISVGVLGLSMQ